MPIPELDYRFKKAQLWTKVGDDEYGVPLISARRELTVRWENKQIEMIGPNGQPIRVDAFVHTICILTIGSIMWRGCAGDLPDDMTTLRNIMEVVAEDDTPDVKGRNNRLWYGLKRYTDKMPELV